MKVAVYARCSTKKQDLETQIKALNDWAASINAEPVLYSDFAISGKKDNREGINRLIEDVKNDKFDIKKVGVVELSRIGRSVGFIHGTVELLGKHGYQIVLTKNNSTIDYTTLEGRALIGGLSFAADIEWFLIQERNERGRLAIKERGVKVGRKRKDAPVEAILALKEKGWGYRKIGAELGIDIATISRRLKERCENGQLRNVSELNQKPNNELQK